MSVDIKHAKYSVDMSVNAKTDTIEHEFYVAIENGRTTIARQVIQTHKALVTLGWTPPQSKTDKYAVPHGWTKGEPLHIRAKIREVIVMRVPRFIPDDMASQYDIAVMRFPRSKIGDWINWWYSCTAPVES